MENKRNQFSLRSPSRVPYRTELIHGLRDGPKLPWHEPVLAKAVRTVYQRNAVLFQYNRSQAMASHPNNIQVMLVCGRPGDQGTAPRHPLSRCQDTKCRPGTPGILKYVIRSGHFLRKGIELNCQILCRSLAALWRTRDEFCTVWNSAR